MRDNRSNYQPRDTEFEEKMIQVSRVSKKTKGGNNVGFSVLMVVGDRKGRVGVGLGKASDVATAMKKGSKKAKKKMILVPLRGTTIPFKVVVKEGAGIVMLKPAPKGSGIIAGGPIRAVVDAAGIRDISSKILGSSNQASSVYATFEALKKIQQLVALRNLPMKSATITAEVPAPMTEPQNPVNNLSVAQPIQSQKPAAEKTAVKSAKKPAKLSKKTTKPIKKPAKTKTKATIKA